MLRGQLWRASREGLAGRCADPRTGDLAPASEILQALVELTAPHLEAAGDLGFAKEGLARLLEGGSGADRQRRTFERGGRAEDVVDLLTGKNP